jgi:type VI secretion system protein
MLSAQVRIQDLTTQDVRVHTFFKSPVHLGRNELNELSLTQPYVSMWHGIVRFDERTIEYVDLGSTNGTSVRGERLPTSVPIKLEPGTSLQIGSLQLQITLGQAEPEAPSNRSKTQFGLRAVSLEGGGQLSAPRLPPSAPIAEPKPSFPFSVSAASAASAPAPAPAIAGMGATATSAPQLLASYLEYRKAYVKLHTGVTERIAALPQEQRQAEVTRLVSRFPALRQEQPFQELLQSLSVTPPAPAPAPSPNSALPLEPQPQVGQPPPTPSDWKKIPALVPGVSPGEPNGREAPFAALLSEFARCYLPAGVPLSSGADAEKFLERLSEVLEAFGKSFLELKKGQQQFSEEMAVRTTGEPGQLQAAKSGKDLLAFILDFRIPGNDRIQELTRGFADVMIHQVALINGVKAGVRAMLDRLSPALVQRELDRAPEKWRNVSFPNRVWPFRSFARWTRYSALHKEFSEEEQAISSVVFGREFARAYAVVTGQQEDPENPEPKDGK